MKRFLSGFIATFMMFNCLMTPVSANSRTVSFVNMLLNNTSTNETTSSATGNLTVVVNFAYPENISKMTQKQIKLILNESNSFDLTGKSSAQQSITIDGKPVTVSFSRLNSGGVDITTENEITYYQIDFKGVPNNQKYKISLSGNGYKSFSLSDIEISNYSKKILIGNRNNTFTIGDVNSDGKVNSDDLKNVEKAILNFDEKSDLSGDNKIDITDIALVHRQTLATGAEEVLETQLIAASVATVASPTTGTVISGKLSDLLSEDGQLKIAPANGNNPVSPQNTIEIPIDFKESMELEQIEIVSPSLAGAVKEGSALVVYEDGTTQIFNFSNNTPEDVSPLEREAGKNTIVIELGRRVAVKKITVIVTKVEGDSSYTVVDEIKFLKDIVPSNPNTDSTVPKGFSAIATNESVALSWKPVSNVQGYLVKYGTTPGVYNKEVYTEKTEAKILGLDNLVKYYFVVCSKSGDWLGKFSSEIFAIPEPNSIPAPPDNLKLVSTDMGFYASWSKGKNTNSYNLYYKKTSDSDFVKANKDPITATSYSVGTLTNNVEYTVYVTSVNSMGESESSLKSLVTPKLETITAPKIPTLHRIDNSNIQTVTMQNKNNVDLNFYPNGFNVNNVIDNDYNTHWTARAFWESHQFNFEFKDGQSYTMDYVTYVPRLDGKYKESIYRYKIQAWDEQGNVLYNPENTSVVTNNPGTTGFAILPFPKTENVHKISVNVTQWDGSPTGVSMSEIAFYEYYNVDEKIKALFTDNSFTKVSSGVTLKQIEEIEEEVNRADGYFVNRATLNEELALAKKLLSADNSGLGKVFDGIQSRNTTGDIKKINVFQPLGVVANADAEVIIYADIPADEKVSIVPTQYFAESASWSGSGIELVNGRNVIKIPSLTTINTEKGGSLYITYSGDKPEKIKLQVRGNVTKIPVLELSDWNTQTETQRKNIIKSYVTELDSYYKGTLQNKMGGKPQTFVKNSTEISMPNVLLSIPADRVYSAVMNGTVDQQIQTLYDNTLAWNDLITVLYKTHGIDNPLQEASRHNIRYARMFANAFMYASGAHIGVGYNSTGALTLGKPVSITGAGNSNNMFGWGIAHEIGHVMDTLGKVEITNNIYSLFGQTYDGNDNTLTSRLEGGTFEEIFKKTAVGAKGTPNNVFAALGMYWQLHLAYDKQSDNFFNQLNKAYRNNEGSQFSKDEKLAVVSSKIANKNLTEFFTRWGIELSSSAIAEMEKYPQETRAIWYFNDQSRRESLKGTSSTTGNISVETTVEGRDVTVSISGLEGKTNVQGYEIIRNGKPVTFTAENSYVDNIGSANNVQITYEVRAYDVMGNLISEVSAQPFVLNVYDFVPKSAYTHEQTGNTINVTLNGDNAPSIAGIYIKPTSEVKAKETKKSPRMTSTELEPISLSKMSTINPLNDATLESSKEEMPSIPESSDAKQASSAPESSSEQASSTPESSSEQASSTPESSSEEVSSAPESSSEEVSSAPESSSEEVSSMPESSSEAAVVSSMPESSSEAAVVSSMPESSSLLESSSMPTSPINGTLIEVSTDGTKFVPVLNKELTSKNSAYLFHRGVDDGSIGIFEAKNIRITNLPDGTTMDDIEFIMYPGDSIDIEHSSIGYMKTDYVYGDDSTDVIKAGSLVIIGNYIGDPVFNTIRVNGKFMEQEENSSEISIVERPINGDVILFAPILEGQDMSEIGNGLWIFVPDIQKEAELVDDTCNISVLPTHIQAVLYRTDEPNSSSGMREVSNTLWYITPNESTMPDIVIKGDVK